VRWICIERCRDDCDPAAPARLDLGVQLVAFGTVQEGPTNALKHAGLSAV
jgi:signal transduction histidine kinase